MKKLLSVILVLVMLLSSVTVIAVADDIEDVTDGAPPVNDESPEATEESSENSSDESDVSEPPVNDDITDEDDFTQDDEPLDDSEEETSGADEVVTEPEETTTEEATTEEATTEEATTEEATTEEITTEPDPFENVPAKLMCDVNNDGKVKAEDARNILRAAVALEGLDKEVLALADADFDGFIRAADARIALRTAVGLEEKLERRFIIKDYSAPDCEAGGYVKVFCVETESEYVVEVVSFSHSLSREALCKGEGKCDRCGEEFFFGETHEFISYQCKGIKTCRYCGKSEKIAVSHSFDGDTCRNCGYTKPADDYSRLVDHVINKGAYEDGIYYVTGSNENGEFSLCYNTDSSVLYVCYAFYVNINGQRVDYYSFLDIPKDFKSYVSEVDCYIGDLFCAYGLYNVNAARLSDDKINNAVSLVEYDSIEGMENSGNEFATIAEGTAVMSLDWLIDYVKSIGITGLTASALGCPQLR